MSKTSILVESETRKRLKQIARKDQTYDQIINDLIARRYVNGHKSLEGKGETLTIKDIQEQVGNQPIAQNNVNCKVNYKTCEAIGCDAEPTIEIPVKTGNLGTIRLQLCTNCANKFKESAVRQRGESYEEKLKSTSIDDTSDDGDTSLIARH